MRNSIFTADKARSIAARLRTSRHHGGGWSAHADRDMAREDFEIHVIAQASHDRVI
ncbi:MAG: hypothetical protein ACJ714_15020 [Ornithinibacter sp.]